MCVCDAELDRYTPDLQVPLGTIQSSHIRVVEQHHTPRDPDLSYSICRVPPGVLVTFGQVHTTDTV